MSPSTHHEGAYTTSDKLEDQAASAALYVTRDTPSNQSSPPLLDEDGKLSSAGAATSLKYARAQDLPSFPSTGGVKIASAGAAASLADHNKKSFEHWKPGTIPAANKAAMLAKDYEMDPLWHPELSKAGSKAALLASRDAHTVDIWKAPETEAGHSAAGQAMGKKGPPAITEREVSAESRQKALLAATGAMASGRRRADSAPLKTPAQAKAQADSTSWAMKAANSSHNAQPSGQPQEFTRGDPGFEAARIQNMAKNKVSKQMYGSAPPVAIEVQEKNRQDTLRASAVAMAQRMYAIQQTHIEEAKGAKNVQRSDSHYAANSARNRALSNASDDTELDLKPAPRYENLEEAARKLAQERLAKIHDEHAEYRSYYGASGPQRSRLSIRGRRRASSQGQADDSDEEQSRQIRAQMSLFTSSLAKVDNKKRQADRDALLEAAHKNVTARMNAMDEKVFQDTGKPSPQQRELWERQARERAQRDSDERMINVGKVHIGGGKYLDQSEVDAIARARLQPTLDEISDKAEKQRARDEEIRLDQERQRLEAETEKNRQAEVKAELKASTEKEKNEERQRKAEEKRVLQAEAAAEKEKRRTEAAAEKERARHEKEEKRKSRDAKPGRFASLLGKSTVTGAATAGAAGAAIATETEAVHARPGTGDTDDSLPAVPAEGETVHDQVTMAQPGATETVYQTTDVAQEPEAHAEPQLETVSAIMPETAQAIAPAAESTAEPTSEALPATVPEADATRESERDLKTMEQGRTGAAVVPATLSPDQTTTTPNKSDSKVKSWFKTRFRTSSKAQNDMDEKPTLAEPGAVPSTLKSSSEEDKPRSESMRDVAMAGRTTTNETEDLYGAPNEPNTPVKDKNNAPGPAVLDRSSSVSSLSSSDVGGEETFHKMSTSDRPGSENIESESESRGRKGFTRRVLDNLKPLPKDQDKEKEQASEWTYKRDLEHMPINNNAATTTDGEEDDDFEEARDTFEEEKLAPPPKLSSMTKPTGSPVGSKERSKFTEHV